MDKLQIWTRSAPALGRRAAVLVAVMLCAITCNARDERQEIHCEEAIQHLQECCPELSVPNVCGVAFRQKATILDGGCGKRGRRVIGRADAACILRLSCEEAQSVCVNVMELQEGVDAFVERLDSALDSGDTIFGVCP